ncbi:MAG: group 1 truncated hemoglobin [Bermanella sp.]|tara:strand:- start:609 stop:1028 length:420 start_codon:yes stop_codon:yes gene_type:complete
MKLIIILFISCTLAACGSLQTQPPLFQQLGGKPGIAKLTDAFIEAIQYNKQTLPYFLESDINRFRTKFVEQICMISGGPCEYTGDSMTDVHGGMNINEAHFNALVNDLIMAMEAIELPTSTQNQLLSLLAPMRKDIIYR